MGCSDVDGSRLFRCFKVGTAPLLCDIAWALRKGGFESLLGCCGSKDSVVHSAKFFLLYATCLPLLAGWLRKGMAWILSILLMFVSEPATTPVSRELWKVRALVCLGSQPLGDV